MVDILDPLPKSSDDYWQGADINKHELKETPRCEHFFVRTKGTEVECKKCRMGYFLTPEFEVKQGHIYEHDTLII
jgi:hypothetical protein